MAEQRSPRRIPELLVDQNPIDRASAILSEALQAVLATSGQVKLAIPGGSALLALPNACQTLGAAWRDVSLTWTDERCVAKISGQSNRGAAEGLGLIGKDAEFEPSVVLPLFLDNEQPSEAVARVGSRFVENFDGRLDVVVLGLGEDGHIASLFPSQPAPGTGFVAYVASSPKPPAERITLTRAALLTASRVIVLAAGAAKREAIRELFGGRSRSPARGLHGLVVVTDQEVNPLEGD